MITHIEIHTAPKRIATITAECVVGLCDTCPLAWGCLSGGIILEYVDNSRPFQIQVVNKIIVLPITHQNILPQILKSINTEFGTNFSFISASHE
jgi:hypothetical protein